MNEILWGRRLCRWPALAGLAGMFILLNAAWLWHFRHGQILDIDEAGYIGIALSDYQGLMHGGLLAFLRMVEASTVQAPVTTAAAALVFALTGPHVIAAFSVTVLCGALSIAAAYLLARELGMGRLALLPALLVASCPFIINYSRDFQFAMPTTCMATAALACLLKSQRMTRLGWGVLFGLCLGLIPLSRTMAVAFLPALLAGTLAYVYLDGRAAWRRQSLFPAIALLIGLGVALSWFIPNGKYVFHYLTGFGYGSHAAQYSDGQSQIGLASLIFTLGQLGDYLCLPQFALALAALPVGLVLLARLCWQAGPRRALLTVLRHPVFPVLCFVGGVVLALSSTANKGDGFIAPAVPAMLVLACLAFQALCRARLYRRGLVTIVAIISVISLVPTLGLPQFSKPAFVALPVFGRVNLTFGAGSIQSYEVAAGYSHGAWPIPPATGRAYAKLYGQAATELSGKSVAFGFRGVLYNVNIITLYQALLGISLSAMVQIDPVTVTSTPDGVARWLTKGAAAQVCLLLAPDPATPQFPPVIPAVTIQAGAVQAGFVPSGTVWTLPDGEHLNLWRRPVPRC